MYVFNGFIYIVLYRDGAELPDCHLSDLLQQLASLNTARPSERDFIRQGSHGFPASC